MMTKRIELTFEQEMSMDEIYMAQLRSIIPSPSIETLEPFARQYRIILCERYPHFRELFEMAGFNCMILK